MTNAIHIGGSSTLPPHETQQGAPQRTPAQVAAIIAAVTKLLIIATYISIMTLLGYKLRRVRTRPAAQPAPRPTPRAATAPAQPRRPQKYMDRDFCLALLTQANEACRDLAPAPQAAPAAAPSPMQAAATTPAAMSRPWPPSCSRPPTTASPCVPIHPQRKKGSNLAAQTRAHFVTIPERNARPGALPLALP